MRPATTSLLAFFLALLLAACGDSPLPPAVTIPIPFLEPGTDRTRHVSRALELTDDPESRALLLTVGPLALPQSGSLREAVTALSRRCSRPDDLGTREVGLTLHAMNVARLVRLRSPGMAGVAETLLARRGTDGAWGDPVTTAWAVTALDSATAEIVWLAERIGTAWRDEIATAVPSLVLDAARWKPVERLHLAILVMALDEERRQGRPAVETQQTVRRLIRGVPVDGDADLLLAWATLWWRAGPATGPEHPAAAAQRRFRERYEAGELSAASPEEYVKLVVALEMFGYDSFGAIRGYLPDCRWVPDPGR